MRTVLAGEHLATDDAVLELAAVNRRGRPVRVQVTVSSLAGTHGSAGALVVMDQLDDPS